jgi:ABC-2 type transport system permease protein
MGKIGLIIKREYLTRVKKRSFLLMTLLGPLLIGALFIVPALLTQVADEDRKIVIVDESGIGYYKVFHSSAHLRFDTSVVDRPYDLVYRAFKDSDNVSVLYIPSDILQSQKVQLVSKVLPGLNVAASISTTLSSEIEKDKLAKMNISPEAIDHIKTPINVVNVQDNKISDTNLKMGLAIGLAMIVYFCVFIYSVQVMGGVIEEKTSRIIEVIISSVKPFQLMMGKIVGIALVGLTQFTLWIILSIGVIAPIKHSMEDKKLDPAMAKKNPMEMADHQRQTDGGFASVIANTADSLFAQTDWPLIMGMFFFYFFGGYFLYSALFAAVGSAVDSEADAGQFRLPVTIPLILSFATIGPVLSNPHGPVAFWLSMIPFTSPVTMMIRIPFGIPVHELIMSMTFLIAGFLIATWIAARIYRVGILMYGKKTTWKELGKWIFYKG